jgi:transcriptional regulator with XRE-family HTH domain
MKKLDAVFSEMFTAEERTQIRRRAQEKIAGLRLAQIREAQHLTQQEAADAMGVSQAALSKLERRPNVTVSALQRYVEALGGRLEVTVLLPKQGRQTKAATKQAHQNSRPTQARRIALVTA